MFDSQFFDIFLTQKKKKIHSFLFAIFFFFGSKKVFHNRIMFSASDERYVLGSKENLTENMENFSLKVNIQLIFAIHAHLSSILSNLEMLSKFFFSSIIQSTIIFCTWLICSSRLCVFFCAGNVRAIFFRNNVSFVYLISKWCLLSVILCPLRVYRIPFHIGTALFCDYSLVFSCAFSKQNGISGGIVEIFSNKGINCNHRFNMIYERHVSIEKSSSLFGIHSQMM